MIKSFLFISILITNTGDYVHWWDVNSNLGFISGSKFTTYNDNLFLCLRPYGVFRFDNKSQSWQSLGPNATQTQSNFSYKDTLYSTDVFFRQKNDKSQQLDTTIWNNISKKYRIKQSNDSLIITEINTDTAHYSVVSTNRSSYPVFHFFDGINLWFSLGITAGDGGWCSGFGYFDTKTKNIKKFSLNELGIKEPIKPYGVDDYSFPSIFALYNKNLWIGTARGSDYGPESFGEGVHVFDIDKKTIIKHIHIGNCEYSPSVLDMSFSNNYLWIATPLGIFRLHLQNNSWSYWKIDTCAIIADTVLELSLGDNTIKFFRKIQKGKIVRLVGQSGGGHESQMHTGSTVNAPFLLEGWFYDSTTNYSNLTSGDTADLKSFKLYERPDTSSTLLTIYNEYYHSFNSIKSIFCENRGDWHKIKFCQIWIPFDDLIYKLRSSQYN